MRSWITLTLSVLATSLFASTAHGAPPWTAWLDARELTRLVPGDQVLLRSSHCPDGCRFDRTSPDDPRFLRLEGEEAVIFDEPGPGAIARIWMTGPTLGEPLDPDIRIRVRLDGEATPRIDLPIRSLFDNTTPPFLKPLVFDRLTSSGGNVSYVPIPYRNGCKITLVGALTKRLWYQFTFHRLPRAAGFESFTNTLNLAPWHQRLRHVGEDPFPFDDVSRLMEGGDATIPPRGSLKIIDRRGAGAIRRLAIRTSSRGMKRLWIEMRFDGQKTVDVPLRDFFAFSSKATTDQGAVPLRSLMIQRNDEGFDVLWFPMPYFESVEITLFDRGTDADGNRTVRVAWENTVGGPFPRDAGYFGAQRIFAAETTPPADLRLFDLDGRGKWVGLALELTSVGGFDREVLEGDEHVLVDGARHPTMFGTGVEDLANGGFYFDEGPFSLPLHGSISQRTVSTGSAIVYSASFYRLMLSDAIPFRTSIRAGLETGPTANLPLRARGVSYFYARPDPALALVDQLDLGDPQSRLAHGYVAPAGEICHEMTARFEGEISPPLTATACRNDAAAGRARFQLSPRGSGRFFRLRRLFSVDQTAEPVEIWIAGVHVGTLPFAAANPFFPWQEVDLDLISPPTGSNGELDLEIVPRGGTLATSRWQLFQSPAPR